MKKIFSLLALICLSQLIHAQIGLLSGGKTSATKFIYGIRAGANISHISNGSALGTRNGLGWVAGIYADQSFGKAHGMREEISYVRTGFKFSNATTQGKISLQYFFVSHLFTFNLGKILQLHMGPQAGVLLKAVADSVSHLNERTAAGFFSVNNNTNRFALGGCAGLEVYPHKGLIIGLRYNLSFTSLNKKETASNYNFSNNIYASNNNTGRLKNEMFQIVAGWRFNTD